MKEYQFSGIRKAYGNKQVLRDASLKIMPGSFVGILGLNGAGKTTLLNILGDVDRNFSGQISLRGNRVAYMRTRITFPEWRTVSEFLKFYERFYPFERERAEEMLGATGIQPKAHLRFLSAGMQRQLNFICNFCVDARILLLDEPLTNLDLIFRDVIVNSLIERAMEERIIIVATHEIKEFENLFTHITILKGGKLSPLTEVEELRAQGKSVEEFYEESLG